MAYNVDNFIFPICIGINGENDAQAVEFDISAWIGRYGEGSIGLVVQRPGETLMYPGTITVNGGNVVWKISRVETANTGTGKCMFIYKVGGVVKKSKTFEFIVQSAIIDGEEEAPDPYGSYVEKVIDAANTAIDMAAAAEAASERAEDAKTTAVEAAESAGTAKSDAETAANAAKEAKDQAIKAENTAVSAKETAVTAKTDAANSAKDAASSKEAAVLAKSAAEESARKAAGSATQADESAKKAEELIPRLLENGVISFGGGDLT